MNTATKITIFRIILVPVFLAFLLFYRYATAGSGEWLRYAAIVVFVVASISDVIDGYIARTRGMITRLGGILDPLADKLLFGLGIIVVSLPPVEDGFPFDPPWIGYPIAVVGTSLVLGFGSLLAFVLRKRIEIKSVPLGKTAAVLQSVTMAWILFKLAGAEYIYYPAGVLTVASGIGYVWGAVRQVHAAKAAEQ